MLRLLNVGLYGAHGHTGSTCGMGGVIGRASVLLSISRFLVEVTRARPAAPPLRVFPLPSPPSTLCTLHKQQIKLSPAPPPI